MNCPYCAEQIEEGAQKCPVCAESLVGSGTPQPPDPVPTPAHIPEVVPNPQELLELATAESKATSALVFGLLSLFCCGIIFGPLGIIFGSASNGVYKKYNRSSNPKATAGFVLGIVGLVFSCIGFFVSLFSEAM